MSNENIDINRLTWHELQDFNELRPDMETFEKFDSKYNRLKRKHNFTDIQMKQAHDKAVRLMPEPSHWV